MPDHPATPAVINEARLGEMLLDIDTPDSEIAKYLRPVRGRGAHPFAPTVEINPSYVEPSATEGAMLLANFNALSRWRRQKRYRRKVGNWPGIKIVSEGDSWEQFPFLLSDIFDHLENDFAILSLGGAGDLVADMVAQAELISAVASERPHAIILSGGGNDLLGSGRLSLYLNRFTPGMTATSYLRPEFEPFLGDIIGHYRTLLHRLTSASAAASIFCHGYDYAIPNSGRWLGEPLQQLGINDPVLQAEIITVIVDRFSAALGELFQTAPFAGRAHLIDCRGSVDADEWYDELHPSSNGFEKVANRFKAAIDNTVPRPNDAALEATTASLGCGISTAADVSRVLASRFSHDELMAELGRRAQLIGVDPAAIQPFGPDETSVALEGMSDAFVKHGVPIFNWANYQLKNLVCGNNQEHSELRETLLESLGVNDQTVSAAFVAVLTGTFGLAPGLAVVVTAILLKSVLKPTLAATCESWSPAPNEPNK